MCRTCGKADGPGRAGGRRDIGECEAGREAQQQKRLCPLRRKRRDARREGRVYRPPPPAPAPAQEERGGGGGGGGHGRGGRGGVASSKSAGWASQPAVKRTVIASRARRARARRGGSRQTQGEEGLARDRKGRGTRKRRPGAAAVSERMRAHARVRVAWGVGAGLVQHDASGAGRGRTHASPSDGAGAASGGLEPEAGLVRRICQRPVPGVQPPQGIREVRRRRRYRRRRRRRRRRRGVWRGRQVLVRVARPFIRGRERQHGGIAAAAARPGRRGRVAVLAQQLGGGGVTHNLPGQQS